MRVLFATAELRPLVSVGGLGEAANGLGNALDALGVDLLTILPDYQGWPLEEQATVEVAGPEWFGDVRVRVGRHPDVVGRLVLVDGPGIARPNPYVDENGQGWADNDVRFAGFSAVVAALADEFDVDIVHLNDWHTGLAPAFMGDGRPTVLTIHNLAHQGWADANWLHRLPRHRNIYANGDAMNALAGAIALVDRVVTVSPGYRSEIVEPADGMGLHELLAGRGDDLVGILNGIDAATWNPATDPDVPRYDAEHMDGKAEARRALLAHIGWPEDGPPVAVMVTRLVDQKGVDLALAAARFLPGIRMRLAILGSGDVELSRWAAGLAAEHPDHVWFHDGYDVALSHLLFAGGDLLLMPSRFEPCGLAQMQAMAYGTIPVVTPVGGLADTVIDADASTRGTGFVAASVDEAAVVDALYRARRAMASASRRRAIQRRGMTTDWSWTEPAERYLQLYRELQSTVAS